MSKTIKRRDRNRGGRGRQVGKAPRIHTWYVCWCGSDHAHEKATTNTVNGLTEPQIQAALLQQDRRTGRGPR